VRAAILLAALLLSACAQEPKMTCTGFKPRQMPEGVATSFAGAVERASVCVDNNADRLAAAPDGSALVAKVAVSACTGPFIIQASRGQKEGQSDMTADEVAASYQETALLEVMSIRAAGCARAWHSQE
jgi:hypothetical protein